MADQLDTDATQNLRRRKINNINAYRDSNGTLYYGTAPRVRPSLTSEGPIGSAYNENRPGYTPVGWDIDPDTGEGVIPTDDNTQSQIGPVTPPVTPPVTSPTAPPGGWVTDPNDPNFGDPGYMAPPGHVDYVHDPEQVLQRRYQEQNDAADADEAVRIAGLSFEESSLEGGAQHGNFFVDPSTGQVVQGFQRGFIPITIDDLREIPGGEDYFQWWMKQDGIAQKVYRIAMGGDEAIRALPSVQGVTAGVGWLEKLLGKSDPNAAELSRKKFLEGAIPPSYGTEPGGGTEKGIVKTERDFRDLARDAGPLDALVSGFVSSPAATPVAPVAPVATSEARNQAAATALILQDAARDDAPPVAPTTFGPDAMTEAARGDYVPAAPTVADEPLFRPDPNRLSLDQELAKAEERRKAFDIQQAPIIEAERVRQQEQHKIASDLRMEGYLAQNDLQAQIDFLTRNRDKVLLPEDRLKYTEAIARLQARMDAAGTGVIPAAANTAVDNAAVADALTGRSTGPGPYRNRDLSLDTGGPPFANVGTYVPPEPELNWWDRVKQAGSFVGDVLRVPYDLRKLEDSIRAAQDRERRDNARADSLVADPNQDTTDITDAQNQTTLSAQDLALIAREEDANRGQSFTDRREQAEIRAIEQKRISDEQAESLVRAREEAAREERQAEEEAAREERQAAEIRSRLEKEDQYSSALDYMAGGGLVKRKPSETAKSLYAEKKWNYAKGGSVDRLPTDPAPTTISLVLNPSSMPESEGPSPNYNLEEEKKDFYEKKKEREDFVRTRENYNQKLKEHEEFINSRKDYESARGYAEGGLVDKLPTDPEMPPGAPLAFTPGSGVGAGQDAPTPTPNYNLKEDKKDFYAKQKEQQDIVRVSENYAEGGLVDRRPKEGKSPPNAGVADDLPRNLSEGEYVIPKHIVDHFGEKFFEDLLDTIPPPQETRVQLKL